MISSPSVPLLMKAVDTFDFPPAGQGFLLTPAAALKMNSGCISGGCGGAGRRISLQETLEAGKEDTALTFSDVLQDSFCMEENCERQEEAARLRQLIEGLPARERKLILLRYGMAGQPPAHPAGNCTAAADQQKLRFQA